MAEPWDNTRTTDGSGNDLFVAHAPLTCPPNDYGYGSLPQLSLSYDPARLDVDASERLTVVPTGYVHPLHAAGNTVSLLTDTTLQVHPDGSLGTVEPSYRPPLVTDGVEVDLKFDATLATNAAGELGVVFPPAAPSTSFVAPLSDTSNAVTLNHDTSLKVNDDGTLGVSVTDIADEVHASLRYAHPLVDGQSATLVDALGHPLPEVQLLHDTSLAVDDASGNLGLNMGKGLKLDADGKVETVIDNVLKGKGPINIYEDYLSMVSDFDIGSMLDWGLSSNADFETSIIALKYDPDFTAKGSKLGLASPGYRRIPYFQLERGFSSADTFLYNDTFSRLEVQNVKVDSNFEPSDDTYVPTFAYVNQLIQAKQQAGAIDVGALQNGRRELAIRVDDATIKVNESNVIHCDYAPAQGSPLSVDNVQATLDVQVDDVTVGKMGNKLQGKYVGQNGITVTEATIECTLQGGTGIVREGDTLNVALTSANTDIFVEGNTITSNIETDELTLVKAGPLIRGNYIAGEGILIMGNVISAVPANITTMDETDEIIQTVDTAGTVANDAEPILTQGPTPLPAFPVVVVPPPPPLIFGIFPVGGGGGGGGRSQSNPVTDPVSIPVLPSAVPVPGPVPFGLSFPVGGWVRSYGRPPQPQTVVDANGNPVLDANGQPTYQTDADGNPVFLVPPQNGGWMQDAGGCLRMGFDSPICWKGWDAEPVWQAVNLDILSHYHVEIVLPAIDTALLDWHDSYLHLKDLPDLTLYALKTDVPANPDLSTYLRIADAAATYATLNQVQNNTTTIQSNTAAIQTLQTTALTTSAAASTYQTKVTFGTGLTLTGATVTVNPVDYTSAQLTNKPTLGALAALGAIDYTSTLLTNKPDLSVYQSKHVNLTNLSNAAPVLPAFTANGSIVPYATLSCSLGTNAVPFYNVWAQAVNSLSNVSAPNVKALAALDTLDYNSTYLVNKPSIPAALTAGTGITLAANAITVNAAQPQITSVGTLTTLTVGTTAACPLTVKCTTAANNNCAVFINDLNKTSYVGIGGSTTPQTLYRNNLCYESAVGHVFTCNNANATSVLTMTGTAATFSVNVSAPNLKALAALDTLDYNSTYLVNKPSIPPALTAGTGITLAANAITVNAAQPQITSVGTLTGVTSAGGATNSPLCFTAAGPATATWQTIGLTFTNASLTGTTGWQLNQGGSGNTDVLGPDGFGFWSNKVGGFPLYILPSNQIVVSNLIWFSSTASAPPSFGTRSGGTRMILWNSVGTTNADLAIGVEPNGMWHSVANTGGHFAWYGGTTRVAQLNCSATMDYVLNSSSGCVRVAPQTAGAEASVGFFNDSTFSGSSQSAWVMGFGSWGTGAGFGLGATTPGCVFQMDITGGGMLGCVNRTIVLGGAGSNNWYDGSTPSTLSVRPYNGSGLVNFTNTPTSNIQVGSITTNGSTTSYNSSSDVRLKQNVVPLADGKDRLMRLKPSRFQFKSTPDVTVDGFLAHETQPVVPESVTGTPDETDDDGEPVYQSMDASKLVPLLVAALQDAHRAIDALTARVTALEAR